MNKRIKVDFYSHPSIGMNQSGMKTQIDTLYNYFKEDDLLDVKKYDIWTYRNPDIVHVFGMGQGIYNHLKLFSNRGVKIICSPNTWPYKTFTEKILMKINYRDVIITNRSSKKYLLEKSDKIIVNSNAEKNMFIDIYNVKPDRIDVIYNSYGDEPKVIGRIFNEKFNITEPYCLMVGQIGSERKNQLRVLKIWKDDFPDLLILGGISESNYAKECLKLIDKKKNIRYLGFESDKNIIESAYQNCDLLISPGIIETPSLVALRALLNGARVCSTNNYGAPKEYFKDNAIYFDALDENDILKSIEYGLNNKWTVNLHDLLRFSDHMILNDYKKMYQNIINR